jgi:hypothetical protein
MGKKVINFREFILLKESVNSIETNLSDKWKRLQELGFYDATTPRIKANGNIILKNDKFNYYPEGILLQPGSGYVRDKGVTSGFLKKGLNLPQMVDYIIDRFEDLESQTSSGISPEVATLLKKISKSKTTKNPETGRFDFSGSVEISRSQFDLLKSKGVKFGVIERNFSLWGKDSKNENSPLSSEDLQFFPTQVKGSFELRSFRLDGFSDFRPLPTKMGSLLLNSIQNLKSLSGAKINPGKKAEISTYYCRDLSSLGGDLPEEVKNIYIAESPFLTSLQGCPKVVRGDFDVRDSGIKDLKGGPEIYTGERYSIPGNESLSSLEGFPLEFKGRIFSSIINCWFSLKDRIRILEEGIYSPARYYADSRGEEVDQKATKEQIEFVATSLSPKYLQELIDKNPERMAVALRGISKDPQFKDLRWPETLKGEVDLLSDLSDVGL